MPPTFTSRLLVETPRELITGACNVPETARLNAVDIPVELIVANKVTPVGL
jgi:hypothetical protein